MSSPPKLRFFLDSAAVSDWTKWLPSGLFYGVTTNPVLLQAAGVRCDSFDLEALAREAFALGAQEVQLQSLGRTAEAYVANGRALAFIDKRVVVKIPTNAAGIVAAKMLIAENRRVTLTAVYTPAQALLASVIGASYSAPYLGRITDAKRDGFGDIAAQRMSPSWRRSGLIRSHLLPKLRKIFLPTNWPPRQFRPHLSGF